MNKIIITILILIFSFRQIFVLNADNNTYINTSNIIYDEELMEYETKRNLVEYLASFWNSEAVQRIRDSRDAREEGRFETDEDFEKKIEDGSLIDHELIRTIREKYKNTNLTASNRADQKGARNVKLPDDLGNLLDLVKESIDK